MAPEIIRGEKCSFGTDLWALGVILYKMATGEDLFGDLMEFVLYDKIKKTKFSLSKVEDPLLKDLIGKLLVHDQNKRLGAG